MTHYQSLDNVSEVFTLMHIMGDSYIYLQRSQKLCILIYIPLHLFDKNVLLTLEAFNNIHSIDVLKF